MPDRPMRLVDGELLPLSDADYAQWLAEAVELPPPPLTARQLRLGLLALGVTREQVEAAIAGISDAPAREAALIEWEYSSVYDRAHPLIGMVGTLLGLTAEQIDAAWSQAATL
jgi:hypothetical protein